MRFIALSTIVVLLLAGCSGEASDPPSPDPSNSRPSSVRRTGEVASAPSADDRAILRSSQQSSAAPDSFKRRSTLTSCGEVAGSGLQPPKTLRGLACLKSATKAKGAELTVLGRTVEGDPVITYYRVSPQIRHVEVFTDWTLDRFGPKGWAHEIWSFDRLQKELAA